MSEALFLSDYQQLLTTLRMHVRRHPRSLQAIERQLGWSLCANVSETLKYREISEGVESNHHGESKPRAARYGC